MAQVSKRVNSKAVLQKNNGVGSILKNKKALTVIGSLVVLVLVGLLSGIVYYYVTYGELPALTASSAGEKVTVCSLNRNGKQVCKKVKAPAPNGSTSTGGNTYSAAPAAGVACGCKRSDSHGRCAQEKKWTAIKTSDSCRTLIAKLNDAQKEADFDNSEVKRMEAKDGADSVAAVFARAAAHTANNLLSDAQHQVDACKNTQRFVCK